MKKIVILSILLSIFFLTSTMTHAQDSLISPTPVFSSPTTSQYNINPLTLRSPEEFALDQKIKKVTKDLLTNPTDTHAQERKSLMKQALHSYPYIFLSNTLTYSQISSFDTQIQTYLEKQITLSNVELGVVHIDDFEHHINSRFDYSLQNIQDKKHYNFFPVGEITSISGTTLTVNGVSLDDEVSARALSAPQGGGEQINDPVPTTVEILQEASPDALGPQRVAVILVKEKHVPNPYYSKEQLEKIIFRSEVQPFLKESSYGKTWIDEENSKVYGWYETEKTLHPYSIDFLEVISLTDLDINFTQFDRVMIGISSLRTYPDGTTSVDTGLGKGDLGKFTYQTADGKVKSSFSTFGIGKNSYVTFTHELGHNFGVKHANALHCQESVIQRAKTRKDSHFIDGCVHSEYGNWLDVMGSGDLNHFNAYFKEVFQWLSSADKSIIDINQPGIYSFKLKPVETKSVIVAKVTRTTPYFAPLYIEYRKTPRDSPGSEVWKGHSGVIINRIYEPPASHILFPGPLYSYPLEYFLTPDIPFIDKRSGLTIDNVSIDTINEEANIRVKLEDNSNCVSDGFSVEIEGIDAYILDNGTYVSDDLTCTNDNCILKRKKAADRLFSSRLKITNDDGYSCPDTRIRAFFDKVPWQTKIEPTESTFRSTQWNAYPSMLIPANIPAGTYTINVQVDKIENSIDNSIIFMKEQNLTIIDDFQTLEGDVNDDNQVDIFDLVTVAKDFGKKGEGLTGDIDKDGDVDIFDLVMVGRNFGKKL